MMQRGAEKLGYADTKDCLFGTYDYKHYCTPKWPYGKGVKAALPPFFGLKEKMPILLGMLMVRLMHVRSLRGSLVLHSPAALHVVLPHADVSHSMSPHHCNQCK